MLYDIINIVVFVVSFSVGGMVLFVLYKKYCSESKHYAFMNDNSSKESRNQLYPALHPVDSVETTAPEMDLSEKDSEEGFREKKLSISLERRNESKAVENDYSVPSDLVNVSIE